MKAGAPMANTYSRKEPISFEQVICSIHPLPSELPAQESMAFLDYDKELSLKNQALALFLKRSGINQAPRPVTPAPKPRAYRTTTKRRLYWHPQGVGLGFTEKVKPGVCVESQLEPAAHHLLYTWIRKTLSRDTYTPLARVVNWVVIRGDYDHRFVILNIFRMDAEIVRKLKQFSVLMEREQVADGAMAYVDPTRSDYYLEAEKPIHGLQTKHLFGVRLLGLKYQDVLMRYAPTVFSQVNEAMVPVMVDTARDLLRPESADHLLDLFCGYGLFSHTLGAACRKVVGVELSQDAIQSAREISKRQSPAANMKFLSARIDADFLEDRLAEPQQEEIILLDPPRKGCEPGVIAALAARRPRKVLHVFCGTNEIPKELMRWDRAGYRAAVIQPLDMFPGTPNLETLVLLEPRHT